MTCSQVTGPTVADRLAVNSGARRKYQPRLQWLLRRLVVPQQDVKARLFAVVSTVDTAHVPSAFAFGVEISHSNGSGSCAGPMCLLSHARPRVRQPLDQTVDCSDPLPHLLVRPDVVRTPGCDTQVPLLPLKDLQQQVSLLFRKP